MDIKDYIVLRQTEAVSSTLNATNNTLTWNIPSTYYSNQRSNVCSVKLIDAYGTANNIRDNKLSILTNLSIQNQSNSGNTLPYLGKLQSGGEASGSDNTSIQADMELLTAPRPTTITFTIINQTTNTGSLLNAVNGAVFVLQFKYYDVEKTTNNLVEQFSPKL